MASSVPPLNVKDLRPEDAEASPRLNEQMTPRALWEMVKEDDKWAVLLDDESGGFSKGDIIDFRYQKYLAEVVPIMLTHNVGFKGAVDILASKKSSTRPETRARRGSPKAVKLREEAKEVPKLRDDEHVSIKVLEKDDTMNQLEPKALDVDMEPKSLSRRDFSKATARSASEPPVTPGEALPERLERPPERVVYVETRPQIENKAVAIQTEELPPSTQPLLQPLLSQSFTQPRPKRSRKPKSKSQELPIQYRDCSCMRVMQSAALKFILICLLGFISVMCITHESQVLAFFGGNQEAATQKAPPAGPAKSKHEPKSKTPAREEHHSSPKAAPKHADDKLRLAEKQLHKELGTLEKLEEEESQTARVGELARLSQQEEEKEARSNSQNKDAHLRQAALDAEVQAKVGQEELKEDADIQKQKWKVKQAEATVDKLEAAERSGARQPSFLEAH